jgi:hypothetical protein
LRGCRVSKSGLATGPAGGVCLGWPFTGSSVIFGAVF